MITDKAQIAAAVNEILAASGFLSLNKEDFDTLAPGPVAMIHVTGNRADEVAAQLKREWTASGRPIPEREIVFIRGKSLRMSELDTIDCALPESLHFKKGIDFNQPAGAEIEIWLFV